MKRLTLSIAAVLALLSSGVAHAQLWIYCGNLPGCPSGFQESLTGVVFLLLSHFYVYAYALAILFVIIGGMYILFSAGDTERMTKGKNTIIWALVGVFLAQNAEIIVKQFIAPEASDAVINSAGSDIIQGSILTAIGTLTDLFYIGLVGVAIYCGMRMVTSMGKQEEFNKFRDGLFWAMVGAIIVNLAAQIVPAFVTL
jgi:hypothetical protein